MLLSSFDCFNLALFIWWMGIILVGCKKLSSLLSANWSRALFLRIMFLKELSQFKVFLLPIALLEAEFFYSCFVVVFWDGKRQTFCFYNYLLSLCSAFTLIISGQYFPYHFLTFFSFSYYSICYFFEEHQYQSFSIFAFLFNFIRYLGQIPKETQNLLQEKATYCQRGKVDRLIDALRSNYKAGDTIQVFDWVDGGTAHALMNLKLPIMVVLLLIIYLSIIYTWIRNKKLSIHFSRF